MFLKQQPDFFTHDEMEHLMESFDGIEWEQSVSGRRKQASSLKL